METVERRHAIGPLIRDRQTVDPSNGVARATRVVSSDLKARCKDNTVDFKLLPVCDDTVCCESLNTFSLGIDQPHVGIIKGL